VGSPSSMDNSTVPSLKRKINHIIREQKTGGKGKETLCPKLRPKRPNSTGEHTGSRPKGKRGYRSRPYTMGGRGPRHTLGTTPERQNISPSDTDEWKKGRGKNKPNRTRRGPSTKTETIQKGEGRAKKNQKVSSYANAKHKGARTNKQLDTKKKKKAGGQPEPKKKPEGKFEKTKCHSSGGKNVQGWGKKGVGPRRQRVTGQGESAQGSSVGTLDP